MQNDANKKIAIMYASDYGYGASKECTINLFDYYNFANCKTPNNWLNTQDEWLLAHYSENSYQTFLVGANGMVGKPANFKHSIEDSSVIRPTLTLSSNVKISGGEGTSSNPYTLSVN